MSPAKLTQLMKAVTPSGCVITEPFQLQDWNFFPEICHTAWHNLRLVLQSKSDPKYYHQKANVCWAYEIFATFTTKMPHFVTKHFFAYLHQKRSISIYLSGQISPKRTNFDCEIYRASICFETGSPVITKRGLGDYILPCWFILALKKTKIFF